MRALFLLLFSTLVLPCLAEIGEVRVTFTNLNQTMVYSNALVRKITATNILLSTEESLRPERWTNVPAFIREKHKPNASTLATTVGNGLSRATVNPEEDSQLSLLLQIDSKITSLEQDKPWKASRAHRLVVEIIDIQSALHLKMLQKISAIPGDVREDDKAIEDEQQRIDNNLDIAKNENWKLYKAGRIDGRELDARDARVKEDARISMLRFKAPFEARQRAVRAQSSALIKAYDEFDAKLQARINAIDQMIAQHAALER